MKTNFILTLFFALFCLTACENLETTVNVDLPQHSPKLVVNSLFNSDTTFQFTVSRSRNILSNENFIDLKTAKIDLYENDVLKERIINPNQGYYRSITKAMAGKSYKIIVLDTSNGETVSAITQTPSQPRNLSASNTSMVNNEVNTSINVQDAQPGTKNYYRIRITGEGGNSMNFYSSDPILTDLIPSGAFGDDEGEKSFYDWAYFTDDVFDGSSKSIRFHFTDWHTAKDGHYFAEVQVLSYDYYRYAATIQLQERTGGDPFATPVIVYNNINGGFGIFAGTSSALVKVK